MSDNTKMIHDVATGEIKIVELTDAEVAELEAQAAAAAAAKAEEELIAAQRATDKAELLHRLGITAEEAALLLS